MATSFQKRSVPLLVGNATGSKSQGKARFVTSTGIPSLDSLLGGGLPNGSLTLIEEDENLIYSKLLLKCFMAQGVYGQEYVIQGNALQPKDKRDGLSLIMELPSQVKVNSEERTTRAGPAEGEIKIAWRYSDMPSAENWDSEEKVQYDFSHSIDEKEVAEKGLSCEKMSNTCFEKCFADIEAIAVNKCGLRVVLEGLNSPFSALAEEELGHFAYRLKSLSRRHPAVTCIVTSSPQLMNSVARRRLHNLVDCVIQLQPFEEHNKLNYPDYEGLVLIHKLPKVNTLSYAHRPETLDLGFQLKRNSRYLVVDKLCLPPELGETPSRSSCGSTNKRLDF